MYMFVIRINIIFIFVHKLTCLKMLVWSSGQKVLFCGGILSETLLLSSYVVDYVVVIKVHIQYSHCTISLLSCLAQWSLAPHLALVELMPRR